MSVVWIGDYVEFGSGIYDGDCNAGFSFECVLYSISDIRYNLFRIGFKVFSSL